MSSRGFRTPGPPGDTKSIYFIHLLIRPEGLPELLRRPRTSLIFQRPRGGGDVIHPNAIKRFKQPSKESTCDYTVQYFGSIEYGISL